MGRYAKCLARGVDLPVCAAGTDRQGLDLFESWACYWISVSMIESFVMMGLVCTSGAAFRTPKVDQMGPSTALAVLPRSPWSQLGGCLWRGVLVGSEARVTSQEILVVSERGCDSFRVGMFVRGW